MCGEQSDLNRSLGNLNDVKQVSSPSNGNNTVCVTVEFNKVVKKLSPSPPSLPLQLTGMLKEYANYYKY